uniref:Uncharacterized protein n=1 Tax=Leersia perrieri TaxID=77586 RepID=A0A0D9WBQ3_9ORYZ
MKTIQDYLSRSKSNKNFELVMKDDIPQGAAKDSPVPPDSSHDVEEEYVRSSGLLSYLTCLEDADVTRKGGGSLEVE